MILAAIRRWRHRLWCWSHGHRYVEVLWSETAPPRTDADGYWPAQTTRELECDYCEARVFDVDGSAGLDWHVGLDRAYELRRWEQAVATWRRHR